MRLAHICRKRVEGREIGANWVVWILRKQGGVNVLGADCTAVRNQKAMTCPPAVRRRSAGQIPMLKGIRINWHNGSKRLVGIHIAKRTA
jgi:hypothetical protein